MRWTWLGLKVAGLKHPDIRRLIVRMIGAHAWNLALEEVQCEHWRATNLAPRMVNVHFKLRAGVILAPEHDAHHQIAVYRWHYRDVFGNKTSIWRR